MILTEAQRYYKSLGIYPGLLLKGKQWGLSPEAVEIAVEQVYPDRHVWKGAIGHITLLRARRLHPKYITWRNRPWWKRLITTIVFPRTIIWEYDQWLT